MVQGAYDGIKLNAAGTHGLGQALSEKFARHVKKAGELQADLEEYSMAVGREKMAHDRLVDKLLHLVDSCEPFLEAPATGDPEVGDRAVKRIGSIHGHLRDILEDEGITAIEVSAGEDFDPYRHEIVNAENLPERVVIKELRRKGYRCGPTVIRKALVCVENPVPRDAPDLDIQDIDE